MPRSRLAVATGIAVAIFNTLAPGLLQAQQREDAPVRNGSGRVRTIQDFPERLTGEARPATVPVPRQGNRVRTAADFERAREERARLAAADPAAAGSGLPADRVKADGRGAKDANTRFVFSIPGADAVRAAGAAGAVFAPAGGKPLEDGGGTAAFQMPIHPDAMTSLVKGHVMTQLMPSEFWVIKSSSNRFLMFADRKGKPLQLREGWSVVEVVLKGENYRWITQPENGDTSPFFEVELTAYHHQHTIVELAGIRLMGPPGVEQWQQAFLEPGDPAGLPDTTPEQSGRGSPPRKVPKGAPR